MKAYITSWSRSRSDDGAWLAQHMLRHEIFISRMSYNVPTAETLEYDQFDTPLATYIVVMGEVSKKALSCFRLIPMTADTMINFLWPELLGDFDLQSGRYLEVTRFGTRKEPPQEVRNAAWDLTIQTIIDFLSAEDFHGVIGVMPKALFHASFQRKGYDVNYLSDPIIIDGRKTVAGLIRLAETIEMRKRTKVA